SRRMRPGQMPVASGHGSRRPPPLCYGGLLTMRVRTGGRVVSRIKACALSMMAVCSLACAGIAPAQAQREIALNSFKGSNVWPVWVAQRRGFFAKEGLAIKNVYTVSSAAQMIGLIKG